jgi:hypothetical protein
LCRSYTVTVTSDGSNANLSDSPQLCRIEKENVDSNSALRLILAPGGGAAVSIQPLSIAQKK